MGKGISRAIHRKGKMLYRFYCRTALTRLLRSRLLAHRVTSRWSDRSKAEIARLLCVSCQTLYDVLKEKQPVTPGMALRLGKLCGNGPDLWLNLQKRYDLHQAERELGEKIKSIPTLEVA
jgi:addiction module HigA family antidote